MSRNKKKNKIELLKSDTKHKKGRFYLNYPDKYMGDKSNIIFRSSWELEAFTFCDNNRNIIRWASEEIAIPYLKPTFKQNPPFRKANYYPDLYVEYYNKKGSIIRELIEIKPFKQLSPSKARKRTTKLVENYTYMINEAKWNAAKDWCRQRNIRFTFMSEKDIFK